MVVPQWCRFKIGDLGVERVISADQPEWVPVFTELSVRVFRKLVRTAAGRGGEQTGTGRRWGLPLADRVSLGAVYYRTNLAPRRVALLLGSRSRSRTGWWIIRRRCWRSRAGDPQAQPGTGRPHRGCSSH